MDFSSTTSSRGVVAFKTSPIGGSREYVGIRSDSIDLVKVCLYNDAKGPFAKAPENLYFVSFAVHGEQNKFVVNATQLECIRAAIPTMVPKLHNIES